MLVFLRRLAIVLATFALLASSAAAKDFVNDDYWAFADNEARAVNPDWDPNTGDYRTHQTGEDTKFNAAMLMLHAAAAIVNHAGDSRQDARMISIADKFTKFPGFLPAGTKPAADPQAHIPGWHSTLTDDPYKNQHVTLDAEVARALAVAWLAGPQVGMPADLRARISSSILAVARSEFYRGRRLNQVNWPADLYASAVATGGPKDLLTVQYRRQLIWLAHHAKPTDDGERAGNFTSGYGLHYAPHLPLTHSLNAVSTTEYGNIVASAFTHLPQAKFVGMPALPADVQQTLSKFQLREFVGEWTSSGYPNWDTGFGLHRLHLTRYWAHAQGTLIAMAKGTGLERLPGQARWAKSVLDHGFELYARWAQGTGLIPTRPFGMEGQESRDAVDPPLVAARMGANAGLAVLEGLGRHPGASLPPVYSMDRDIGRLAISTPSYSTAIVRRSNAGYGGIEMARLMGPQEQVLGTLGGRAAAAFGLRVLRGGRVVLDTQPGTGTGVHPLSSLRGVPSGSGTFARLKEVASGAVPGVSVRVSNDFRPDRIFVTHTISAKGSSQTAQLTFPSGPAGSWFVAGTATGIPADGKLATGRKLQVRGPEGGYSLVFTRVSGGATYRISTPPAQTTAPHPGPTLIVSVPARAHTVVSVAIYPLGLASR